MEEKLKPAETSVPEDVKETPIVKIEENVDVEATKVDPLLDGYYKTNPFFYEVANYFNVEQRDFDSVAPKLSLIVDWVMEKFDVKAPEDILLGLRKAEGMVQQPAFGEKRFVNLFKYARLDQQETAIKKAKKAFERNING